LQLQNFVLGLPLNLEHMNNLNIIIPSIIIAMVIITSAEGML